MGLPCHLHLRLGADLYAELESYGLARGLAVGTAARLLLIRAVAPEADALAAETSSPAALAALVAAEHAVLMVASILPEGEQRMRALTARATQSAEERLAFIRELPAAPEEGAR